MHIQNLIGGELTPPAKGKYIENINPATLKCISYVPDSCIEDLNRCLEKANKVKEEWKNTHFQTRGQLLKLASQAIEKNIEELAYLESLDTGKPLSLAKTSDIPRAQDNLNFFSQLAWQQDSSLFEAPVPSNHKSYNLVLKRPRGIVGIISPWNFPLHLLTWKIAPALLTGNVVIAKPSELTPSTAHRLSELLKDIFPAGVLNFIHGYGNKIGEEIVKHPDVKAISFTGGTQTGRHLAQLAGGLLKPYSLELGGKNPTIIFEDADLKQAVEYTLRSAFTNQGQVCLSGSRIYVQKAVYEKFKSEFIARVKKLKVGDPLNSQTDLGTVISLAHKNKILDFLLGAKNDGGIFLTGASNLGQDTKDAYLEPTVIEGLSENHPINQKEVFGPVVTLQSFDDEQEVIQYANGTEYGLAANIWTKNLDRSLRVSEALHFGIVWVNTWSLRDLRTPFGGVKSSGVGREGGKWALDFFTEPKNICIQWS